MSIKNAGPAPRFLWLALLLLAGLGAGCSHLPSSRQALAQAGLAGMSQRTILIQGYAMTVLMRQLDPHLPLHVYIEGDGKAWLSRLQPSPDPTPQHALALQLALRDGHANVAYMARPCQFSLSLSTACREADWTELRFSAQLVAVMDAAMDGLKMQHPRQSLELIGYSGGAAMAVLLAARRSDVVSLRTVAGNLDQVALNRYHRVSAMPDSLNAMDVADRLRDLPQIHYSAARDAVVPAFITQAFVAKIGACARSHTVAGAGHEQGWLEVWAGLLAEVPRCGG